MSLTETEITAGQTYTVAIPVRSLSMKRRNDAIALVKGIDGRVVGLVYDPQNPNAYKTGYYESTDTASAKYDGTTQAWTVTIPDGGGWPLNDLRNLVSAYSALVSAYSASVTVASETPAEAAATPAPARPARPQPSAWGRTSDLEEPEYGDGFTVSERRAFGGK